jgi:hypothetical protein
MCIVSAQPVKIDLSISTSVFLGGLVGRRRLLFDSLNPPEHDHPPPLLMGVVGVGRVSLPTGTSKESIKKLTATPAALDDPRQLL